MNPSLYQQIVEAIDTGIFVVDTEFIIRHWNRWMELHSGISAEVIVGKPAFDFYPALNNPKFIRNCKTIFAFGNHSFMSQKLHRYLVPLNAPSFMSEKFEHMQQSCSLFPLRDSDNSINKICVCITDMTDIVAYEMKLIGLSIQDSLTGAFNRRHLSDRLKEEFERYQRHQRTISLIMIDIDHFKHINDTYGHQCGDEILRAVSRLLGTHLRKIDMLARYGGEEFCCVLPETEADSASQVAERMRMRVAENEFMYDDRPHKITISLGISQLRNDTVDLDMLLREADDALYEAKRAGRNRVVIHRSNFPPNVKPKP